MIGKQNKFTLVDVCKTIQIPPSPLPTTKQTRPPHTGIRTILFIQKKVSLCSSITINRPISTFVHVPFCNTQSQFAAIKIVEASCNRKAEYFEKRHFRFYFPTSLIFFRNKLLLGNVAG